MSKTKQIVMSEKLASMVESEAERLGLNESELIRNKVAHNIPGDVDGE